MKTNLLALSIVKTIFILFHSKKLKPYKTFKLKINGVNIQQALSDFQMTVEKPKPKQLLRPITTGAGRAMNQSQFLVITFNSL